MPKAVAIIQARMGSSRLPGKVLKKVLNKTLLEYQLERLRQTKLIDEFVIATTINQIDDPIVSFCKQYDIAYYRGSEEDVLSRYYEAAVHYNADVVVRLTSDCPLIDPIIVDEVIQYYLDHEYDYVSNTLTRTYPRGMDTEVFSFNGLRQSYHEAKQPSEREHVTPYIYQHPNQFRLGSYTYFENVSEHRWTVDTVEDFELIKKILEYIYPKNENFTLKDILDIFDIFPNWIKINQHVEQKNIY